MYPRRIESSGTHGDISISLCAFLPTCPQGNCDEQLEIGLPGDCLFETWITLEDLTVQVRNRLTNKRKDVKQCPAMDQELPAVYTIGKLHRRITWWYAWRRQARGEGWNLGPHAYRPAP
jgi:hypothetical protein